MNFQVTVLKVLVSYPDGFAAMADLKRDMAILTTSGRDWTERTKRLAARVPGLDIFSQGLVERLNGGWRITEKGRAVLEVMETRPAPAEAMDSIQAVVQPAPDGPPSPTPSMAPARRKRERKRRRRDAVPRRQANVP
ncbi:hypothetical protein ACVIGB_003903 [Bradyrhizobium sp. USDA 4341]|uniref:hypothetical protein n=1 Tax=Bradyrhizobium erythrophlei TaxID=1437360 RepID=UPI000B30962B|nr:hypothetical protein [Bradyrhizobium erythrophlei]